MNLFAVIMAGGSGTRFWPLSRKRTPKQLLKLSQSQSMLQQTVERLQPLIPYERIIIVTTKDQVALTKEQLPQILPENILVEVTGRNTAPAIAFAAFHLKKKDPQAAMVVLPADHLIKKVGAFRSLIKKAAKLAQSGNYLITLGIKPDCPHTGYGYIIPGEQYKDCFKVKCFVEKPSLEKAERLLAEGLALWNSGMFIWSVESILSAFRQYLPEIYESLSGVKNPSQLAKIYPGLPSVSIDYGIMEKANNVYVFPADLGWNDLGSWTSLGEIFPPDKQGNVCAGKLLSVDSHNLVAYSPDKLVVGLGVNDLVVVDTGDVLLVCAKKRVQDVKKIVDLLKEKGLGEYL